MSTDDQAKDPELDPSAPAASAAAEEKPREAAGGEVSPPGALAEAPAAGGSAELEAAMEEALASLEQRAEAAAGAPLAPTKKEFELKLQILELQRRLRQLELDLEKRTQEVKQNFEQGRGFKEQLEVFRVRVQREKADWFNYGHEPLARELLPVVDNLERALAHAIRPEDYQALREGVALTCRLFLQVLSKFGIEPVPALGQRFNPAFHEAMRAEETNQAAPNTVVEEHRKGFVLRDRLLRPSLVTISRRPPAREAAAAAEETTAGAEEPPAEGIAESEPTGKSED